MSVRAIEKGYSYIGAWDEDAQHEPARAREFALRTIRAVSDKVQRQQHSKQAARASEVGKTDSQGSKDIGADSVAA